jgi:hypothetical protein
MGGSSGKILFPLMLFARHDLASGPEDDFSAGNGAATVKVDSH